ncbi:GMC oxidoreductase [Streptomyces sp. NPDC005248]|uniref:GMC oxidoreductase n=1 Tax=Streptomyces sp. NPDC005248 TaxID=3364709 RepID=UPI0036774096
MKTACAPTSSGISAPTATTPAHVIGVDETAVVDPDLRVHGVSGLRMADTSVMPSVISANTNATVYAIAERAAELVRTHRSGTRGSP